MNSNDVTKILEMADQLNMIRNEGVKILKANLDTETYFELESAISLLENTFRNVAGFVSDVSEVQRLTND